MRRDLVPFEGGSKNLCILIETMKIEMCQMFVLSYSYVSCLYCSLFYSSLSSRQGDSSEIKVTYEFF